MVCSLLGGIAVNPNRVEFESKPIDCKPSIGLTAAGSAAKINVSTITEIIDPLQYIPWFLKCS